MKPKYVVVLLAVLLAAAPLHATTRATDYPGSVSILLGVESVREDLALTDKQKARLNALRSELRSKSRALTQKDDASREARIKADQKLCSLIDRNNACALAVLTPAQSVRFHEIQNQALGYTILVSPKIQKTLAIDAKQVIAIEKIRLKGLDFVAATNRSYEEGRIPQSQRIHLLRDYRTKQAKAYKDVLTPAQRKAFDALAGHPLKG